MIDRLAAAKPQEAESFTRVYIMFRPMTGAANQINELLLGVAKMGGHLVDIKTEVYPEHKWFWCMVVYQLPNPDAVVDLPEESTEATQMGFPVKPALSPLD